MRIVALAALVLLAACSPHGGPSLLVTSTATPAATKSSSRSTLRGDEDVRPVVLVHGISGSPSNWDRIIESLGRGRTVMKDAYADDIAALATGSVSRSSVWAVGFYKRSAKDAPYFQGRGSIGGCPVARTDAAASYYPIAYVDVLGDAIEGVLRATGAPRVDLVGCSMGGVVTRAYLRWRGGASRVRRFLILESPSRGLNDLEAIALAFDPDKLPFQRWGEMAELARDYPAWGGESFIHRLNDGWDADVTAQGMTYGCIYGSGHSAVNPATFQLALDAARKFFAGASTQSPSAPPPPASGPGGVPPAQATVPGLGLAPTSGWVTLQQALIFLDWKRLDVVKDVGEILSDADGFVRVSSGSALAGPELPHALFDSRFRGLHMDRGQPEETIQYCTNTREGIRRFLIEGRVPSCSLVAADLRLVVAGAAAPWLLLDVEQKGDGFSVQVVTEDEALWQVRQALPFVPDQPVVHAAPAFEGRRRIRLDGEPAGARVATVYFYDASGIAATAGPFRYVVPPSSVAPEPAPETTFVSATGASVKVAARGRGAEFSWRLVSSASVGSFGAWSASDTISLAGLAAGTYELTVRSRNADNAAGELVEEADPLTVGVRVDGAGAVEVR